MTVNESASEPREHRQSGQQVVRDYVGQPAGNAAKAVRSAGLRPALERSFGREEALVGRVVAQDPMAGTSLGRNSMVTLHVAAPTSSSLHVDDMEHGEAVPSLPVSSHDDGARVPITARRRKPGARQAQTVDVPPRPARPPGSGSQVATQIVAAATPPWESPTERETRGHAEDSGSANRVPGRGEDEFTVSAEDLFANQRGRKNRRRTVSTVVLRRRGASRRWLGEHRLLTVVAGISIAAWLLVAVASVVGSHHGAAQAGSQSIRPAVRRLAQQPKATRERRSGRASAARRSPVRGTHPRRASGATRRPSPTAPSLTVTVMPAVSGPAVAAARAVPEQSGGGPFSP
jgi:hypothetical protein